MQPSPVLRVLKYRHIRLTTKDVNKGFYKGNRTGAMGRHTRFGGYKIEWDRVRSYVVPERLRDPDFKVGSSFSRFDMGMPGQVQSAVCTPRLGEPQLEGRREEERKEGRRPLEPDAGWRGNKGFLGKQLRPGQDNGERKISN